MKGKKILTLVSAAMGLAIVGSTFAAWAVTDNADPFGIKVSPGQVGPDTTQFVTLSYGTSTFANVNNLEAGKPRLAGSILLKADTNDGSVFPYSVFDIALQDQSNGKGVGEAKLVDLLQVDVYDEAIEIKNNVVVKKGTDTPATSIGHIPTEDDEKEVSIEIEIPSGTGKMVYVVVSLDGSTDAKTLEEIANDVVYLQMDLNKSASTPIATTTKMYLNKNMNVPEGYDMYVYAWSATNKNAAWPGLKMTLDDNGYYSYDMKVDFTSAVFNVSKVTGEEVDTKWQTVDLTLGADQRGDKPAFTPSTSAGDDGKYSGSWGAAPNPEITVGYYVVGDKKGTWAPAKANKMTMETGNEKHYTAELSFDANEKFKVTNQNKSVWFSSVSTWEGCGFTIDDEGNLVVTTAGTYTVNLYTEGEGGNCITIVPKAA